MTEEWTRQCPATDSHDRDHAPYIPDEYEICDWCLQVRNRCVEETITVDGFHIYGYIPASQVSVALRSRCGDEITAA